ncbi:hypothetical protein [Oligoflexus tunisiensis]|uniref:hypothetical protein n=1 Tax=Oligoflexus tunisiensis TaxID=708132 RepID=UPI00114D0884|nr:hypothetical protein [Oligoflexus tunisiensis]
MKAVRLATMMAAVSWVPMTNGCVSLSAKRVVEEIIDSTADLSTCAIQTRSITNLYPTGANTQEMTLISKDWKEGGTGITLSCLSRDTVGSRRIDGTVKLDGMDMQYAGRGVYSSTFDGLDHKPRTISIVTTSGQTTEITVQPPQALKLISVNGASQAARVDLSKDMTLEFADFSPYSFVRVALVTEGLEGRNFAHIGVFKADRILKIPAVAFGHHSLGTSSKIVEGANYVLVEQFNVMPGTVAGVGSAQNIAMAWAWMPVTVSGQSPAVAGIEVSGTLPAGTRKVAYAVSKPNASHGKPLSQARKFAIASLSIRGRLHEKSENEVPLASWDNALKKFHDGLSRMFKKEFGITIIAPEKVLNSSVYKEFDAIPDVYTKESISRSFKGMRSLNSPRLTSSTFPADKPDMQLMRDLGVDGLISVEIEVDGMTTSMTFRIVGEPNAYTVPTLYSKGEVHDEPGMPWTGTRFTHIQSLDTVLRKNDLIAGMKKALKEQEAQARTLGYESIWNMQSDRNKARDLVQDFEILPTYASGQ